ncbi:MAG: hypothetical protein K8R48_05605 [Alphaproteobacteria bacterium]|nr:hypothetical protein [Alphaproteobacteria bacterium]
MISKIFNEAGVKEFKAIAEALGLPSADAALFHAFCLLDLAKKAKEQGKVLGVLTVKDDKVTSVDAVVTPLESGTGNIKVTYTAGSTFKLNP